MVARWLRRWLPFALIAWGQASLATNVPGTDNIHFRTFGPAQGMSHSTVLAMAQDTTGFFWVGTQDGLNRFDGSEFRVYKADRDDPWSLPQNYVLALASDSDGSLWVGTRNSGLSRYDPLLDRFEGVSREGAGSGEGVSDRISALLLDKDRRLWVTNASGQVLWLDRVANHLIPAPVPVIDALRAVRSMMQSQDGRVWFGTREGLWRVDADGRGLRELRASPSTALNVFALAQTPDGRIWVGTNADGLYAMDQDGAQIQHYVARSPLDGTTLHDQAVRALLANADGTLWIAGENNGLARFHPASESFSYYQHDPSRETTIAANRLASLLHGRDDLLFVGSWANGFSVHNPRTRSFTRIESVAGNPKTLPTRQARTVFGDADGTLWAGMLEGGGLVHVDPDKGVVARYRNDPARDDSLSHDFVQYVTRTRDGSLWVATIGGGLNRMLPGNEGFQRFRHDPENPASLADDAILTLYEDRAGTLWIGTRDHGFDELCAGCSTFVHHPHSPTKAANGLAPGSESIWAISSSVNGELWLGSLIGGLERYTLATGQYEKFRFSRSDPTSIGGDSISTFTVDSRGELWIGTQGSGLSHLLPDSDRKPRFETFGSRDGLATDAVGAILEDADGNLWISTTVGISKFDRLRRTFTNFGPFDGTLPTGYWVNGGSRLPGGRMVFAGLDGITIFNPRDVKVPPPPKVVATRFLLQNEPVALRWKDATSPLDSRIWEGGLVDLRYDDDNVSFEFSALDFVNSESIRYSYLLDGHDSNWIETPASRRIATYTDLPSGSYRLRLRARYEGNVEFGEETVLDVRVQPSPWKSPLAGLAYLAAAILLALLVGWRVRAGWRRRNLAALAIRESEERLKLSLWGSGGELWDVDIKSGHLHRENKLASLAVTTERVGDFLDDYRPYIHSDDLPAFNAAIRSHLTGASPVFESSYRTPDAQGHWAWVLTRGRVVDRDAEGRALRMVGTTHDISALKSAEAALRKLNDELESRVERRTADLSVANSELKETLDRLTHTQGQLVEAERLASLGGLVAGVAHEINTPIGISVTAASHLEEEATRISRLTESGELKRSDLQRFEQASLESSRLILRNLQRAAQLVRSFKQVAVDQTDEARRVVDLEVCINEILVTLGPALKRIPHQVTVHAAEPVVCNTAPGALYQVISNLVMNSIIHGFADGRTGAIDIRVSRDGEHAVIEYRDNGVGMDELTCSRMFDPFFTTRRGTGGSGLGMHIVYNLVTKGLGGTIVVDSAPGKGINLCIRFMAPREVGAMQAV